MSTQQFDVKLNFGEAERGIETDTFRNVQDDEKAARPIELLHRPTQVVSYLSIETAEDLRSQLAKVLELIERNSAPL